ncbi:unnamed protein product [Calypogeia fissa]
MAKFVGFAALCLLLSVSVEVVTATCNQGDSISLEYCANEFPLSFSAFSTWVDGTDCCGWKGVTCDGSGNVVDIYISIPDPNSPYPGGQPYDSGTGFTTLPNLRNVTMKNVAFNGQMPASWATLAALRALRLPSCNIVGSVPTAFCGMTEIEEIDLSDNLLTGPLPDCFQTPFTFFSKLTFFNISGNNFS